MSDKLDISRQELQKFFDLLSSDEKLNRSDAKIEETELALFSSPLWEKDGRRGALKADIGDDWRSALALVQSGAKLTAHISVGMVEDLRKRGIRLDIKQAPILLK